MKLAKHWWALNTRLYFINILWNTKTKTTWRIEKTSSISVVSMVTHEGSKKIQRGSEHDPWGPPRDKKHKELTFKISLRILKLNSYAKTYIWYQMENYVSWEDCYTTHTHTHILKWLKGFQRILRSNSSQVKVYLFNLIPNWALLH